MTSDIHLHGSITNSHVHATGSTNCTSVWLVLSTIFVSLVCSCMICVSIQCSIFQEHMRRFTSFYVIMDSACISILTISSTQLFLEIMTVTYLHINLTFPLLLLLSHQDIQLSAVQFTKSSCDSVKNKWHRYNYSQGIRRITLTIFNFLENFLLMMFIDDMNICFWKMIIIDSWAIVSYFLNRNIWQTKIGHKNTWSILVFSR
jgi:hypothetical protein